MKRIVIHIIGVLLLISFISCNDSEDMVQDTSTMQKRVAVNLDYAIPLIEWPSSRAITDDNAIDSYTIWVYSNDKFVEAIDYDDTYQEDGKSYPMATLKNNGNLYVLLPEGLSNVTLVMIANVDVESQEPNKDDSLDDVKATFVNGKTINMPMYGSTTIPLVALGAKGGTIVLRRSMAKIEVQASGAIDHFKLKSMYAYHTNASGTVNGSTISNGEIAEKVHAIIPNENTDNSGCVYLPEMILEKDNNNKQKTFIIISGTYKSIVNGKVTESTRWYKLEFIRQNVDEASGKVTYSHLEEILRNYRYVFDIQYLTTGTGYESEEEAIAGVASNSIYANTTELIVIRDEHIMDITTNNYIYLGVTAGIVNTTEGNDYHVANISIVTNDANGWKFESLPTGVSVSRKEYKSNSADVVSVWVFLDKTKYRSGASETIYVYGNNIRKSITIKVP